MAFLKKLLAENQFDYRSVPIFILINEDLLLEGVNYYNEYKLYQRHGVVEKVLSSCEESLLNKSHLFSQISLLENWIDDLNQSQGAEDA